MDLFLNSMEELNEQELMMVGGGRQLDCSGGGGVSTGSYGEKKYNAILG